MNKTIRQTITFNASPHEVFELLMDSKKHSALTNASAKISRKIGGAISIFDNWITGKNLEIVPDKKIVQSWHAETENWSEDYFSKVTFVLKKDGKKTKLRFIHAGVPEQHYQSLKEGWYEHYWNPMKSMFEK